MDKLLIEEEYIDDVVVISLHGLIDSGTSQFLEDKFKELVTDSHVRVVVDLKDIDYVSSAGWGIFVSEIKGIRHRGGDIKLAGMHHGVREVFDLLEFDALLTPYGSKEEALEAFENERNKKLT